MCNRMLSKGRSDHHQMIKNIFPLLLLFILVSPISRTQQKNGETFPLHNFKTLVTLSSQSSKILADFQGKDKMDTQRNESSPRALIRNELDNNRINNLKINDKPSYSGIEKKALIVPQKTSRAFLMFVHSVRFCRLCYMPSTALMVGEREISQHLKVDRSTIGEVITLPSLPAIEEWNILGWEDLGIN